MTEKIFNRGIGIQVPLQNESERKVKREIANLNERRRMENINTGFRALKSLIPHTEGDKLSKAAVLHQTTEYIYTLKQDRNKLLGQNAMLKQLLSSSDGSKEVVLPYSCKRARTEIEDKLQKLENFIGEDQSLFIREIKRDIIELVSQLDRERRLRMILEEQNRALERQLYPDCQVFNFDNYRPTTGCSQIASHFSDSATGVANCPNLYNSNNLDAMVEAIRRIEGDKTFDQKSY